MNRPVLPYAISSIPATDLPFAAFDHATISMTIASLLESYDKADVATSIITPSAAFTPVSARSHVNRARRSPTRIRMLANA